MTRTKPHSTEEGSVLLLIIGLVVLAALFVTIVIDISALYLDRRELIAAADGAVLAGAQAVDKDALYLDGLPASGPIALDEPQARALVHNYLTEAGIMARYEGLVVEVVTTSTTVSVHLTAVVELPVVNSVTPGAGGGVEVESSATARSAVVG